MVHGVDDAGAGAPGEQVSSDQATGRPDQSARRQGPVYRGIVATVDDLGDGDDSLVWDAGNLAHLAERNAARRAANQRAVTPEEVDALYESADYMNEDVEYLTRNGWEVQVRLIGRTPEGRFLTVACDVLEDTRLRPAAVWLSSGAERSRYRRWRENEGDHDGD